MKFLKGCLAVFGVLMVIGFIGAIIGGDENSNTSTSQSASTEATSTQENTKSEPVKKAPALKVTAGQLLAEYEANELAADGKYTGKTAEITGVVNSIEKMMGSSFVTLGSGKEFEILSVQAFFDEKQESKLASLKKGQKLTVTCVIDGKSMNISAKDCQF